MGAGSGFGIMRLIAILIIVSTLGFYGQLYAAETVAKIADREITDRDIVEYARKSPSFISYLSKPGGPMQLLNNMIIEDLLLREGERLSIPRDPGNKGGDIAYITKIKKRLLQPCLPPTESEMKEFYQNNSLLFSTPLLLRLSRIGLQITDETIQSATAKLRQLKQKITNSEITFSDAATKFSQDEIGADRAGDIGFIPIDVTENALYKDFIVANEQQIIGPIQEPGMLYLYQVTDRRPPILDDYEIVQDEVKEKLQTRCNLQALDKLMNQLKKRWPVTILVDDIGIHPESG